MPRRIRARVVKEPPEPVVYEVSPELETVMHRVIRLHADHFGWTRNFKLGGVIVRGSKPKDEGGCHILARFVKAPPLWHGLTGYDAIVRVEGWAWARLDASGQEALVAHELSHGQMSDKGTLRVLKHDLEEFAFVVRHYGAWRENIAIFDRQLELFEPGFGRAEPGEQTTVLERVVDELDGDGVSITASTARVKPPTKATATVDEAGRATGYGVTH